MTRHMSPYKQPNAPTYVRAPSLQAALSKRSLAVFHFFFRPTDVSAELRWRPICSCTFKGARPHTRFLFILKDTCSRNKLNQMSVLQTSFHIPRLRPPPRPPPPDLLFYSPKPFLIQQPPNCPFHCLRHRSDCTACARNLRWPVHKHTTTNTNNWHTHTFRNSESVRTLSTDCNRFKKLRKVPGALEWNSPMMSRQGLLQKSSNATH